MYCYSSFLFISICMVYLFPSLHFQSVCVSRSEMGLLQTTYIWVYLCIHSACNSGDPSLIPGSGSSPGEGIGCPLQYSGASLVAQMVKNLPAVREAWVTGQTRREPPLLQYSIGAAPFHCSLSLLPNFIPWLLPFSSDGTILSDSFGGTSPSAFWYCPVLFDSNFFIFPQYQSSWLLLKARSEWSEIELQNRTQSSWASLWPPH